MPNIPTTTVTDGSQIMYPTGGGGKPVLIIGDAGFTKNTSVLYTFNSYAQAAQATTTGGLGVQPTDWTFPLTTAMRAENQLLAAVADVFNEGGQKSPNTLGIDTVYAVNIGSSPSSSDFTSVFALTAPLGGLIVELYPNQNNVLNLIQIGNNLTTLEDNGSDRVAVGCGITDATLTQLENMTSSTILTSGVADFVINSRVIIRDNPLNSAKTAAKIACTPYYMDPAYGPYRSMQPSEVIYRQNADLDTLTGDGIMCDWIGPNGPEICMAVSTGYTEVSGERAADGLLHHRLNVDYQSAQVMNIVQQLIKQNNTSIADSLAEQAADSYLSDQKQNNFIEDYTISVIQSPETAYGLTVNMAIMPEPATYFIQVNRTVLAPTGGS